MWSHWIRMGPNPMTVTLIRRENTQRGCHMKTKADTGVRSPKAKEVKDFHQPPGSWLGSFQRWEDFFPWNLHRAWNCQCLEFWLAPRTLRGHILRFKVDMNFGGTLFNPVCYFRTILRISLDNSCKVFGEIHWYMMSAHKVRYWYGYYYYRIDILNIIKGLCICNQRL